eukprot:886444_1
MSENSNTDLKVYKQELLVYGFTRLTVIKIPSDIFLELFLFYKNYDIWNKEYSNTNSFIVNDDYIIAKRHHGVFPQYSHFYGDKVISNNEYFDWKLKIDGEFQIMYIGIIKNDDDLINKYVDGDSYSVHWNWTYGEIGNGYLLHSKQRTICYYEEDKKKGTSIKYSDKQFGCSGDVIQIKLDLTTPNHGAISFGLNGIDCGVAYNKIPKYNSYRLALCAYNQHQQSKVEML